MVWKLKSDIEINKETEKIVRSSRSPIVPLMIGALAGSISGPSFMLKFGDYWEDAFTKAFFIFLIVFVSGYLIQIKRKRRLFTNQTFLCLSCQKSQGQAIKNICECGGKLLPIDYFIWIKND